MQRIIKSGIVLIALALGTSALAQTFTAGNLVIYRVGGNSSGGTSGVLTNRGNVVWLDEYTTNGLTRVQSIMMPTNYFGANSPLIGVGTTFGSGLITRSVDGRFILVAGYGARTDQFNFSLQSAFGTEAPRVIGLVDGNGHIDTTTTQTNDFVNGVELRSATSTDGTNLWFCGSANGVRYTARGSAVATSLPSISNSRQINIFSNQLYFSTFTSADAINVITNDVPGTIPTTTNNAAFGGLPGVTNTVPSFTSPWAFVFFKLKAGGADPYDTLYVADAGTNSASGSIRKFSLVGATWSNDGSIRASGAVGLTGQMRITGSTTNVDLWIIENTTSASGNDSLAFATDSSGYHGLASGNANLNIIATSANSVSWRGIAFAPVGGETFPSGPANLSAGPLLDFYSSGSTGCSATETDTYSIANFGTSTMNWQANCPSNWVSFSQSSGSLDAGGSVTVSAFFNANATSLPSGTNTTSITFTNITNGIGTQSRYVQLIMRNQNVIPSSDFASSGQLGGPFSPLTKVYTVFNGSTPITLVVTNAPAATWLNIGSPTVSLGACSSTNITISINTNAANALANGNYASVITISNATANTVIDTVNAQLSVGGLFFCDDFSTFTQNANLVPQQGWVGFGGSFNEPYVTNNAVYVGATVTQASGDEPYKNFSKVSGTNNPNASVFCAMVMTVTSAAPVATASPSRIVTFFQNQNSTGYARDSLTVRDTGTGTFVIAIRNNGIPANAYVFGTTPLNYNTPYRVIVQGEVGNTNSYVYVNPSSPTLNTGSAYVTMTLVSGSDPDVGSVQIGNTFNSAAFNYQAGIAISKMCVTTNYADAYNDITTGPADPYTAWTASYGLSGGNAAGTADPDGDGMINTNEFLAGFNPTDSEAFLHVISIVNTGINTKVTYLGANGDSNGSLGPKTNVLEFTKGTANGSYSNNFVSTGQTNILSGGNGSGVITNMVDPGGATNSPTRYYRVRVLVP
jgi:hypothetical protein